MGQFLSLGLSEERTIPQGRNAVRCWGATLDLGGCASNFSLLAYAGTPSRVQFSAYLPTHVGGPGVSQQILTQLRPEK